MDWTLILTGIGAVATVISTIVAISAKNEAKSILNEIIKEKNRNIKNEGDTDITNNGNNYGIISGVNSGEIKQ